MRKRKQRNKSSIPVISLVGYTNVGKSALFNYLAKENIFVKNQLFATLDTTMRKVNLISELYIILSDTVGFISDLPTQLIISFKTTLEEINFSNYIIHVIDISNPDWESQKKIVLNTLKDILKDNYNDEKIIEVWNKCDLLNEEKTYQEYLIEKDAGIHESKEESTIECLPSGDCYDPNWVPVYEEESTNEQNNETSAIVPTIHAN